MRRAGKVVIDEPLNPPEASDVDLIVVDPGDDLDDDEREQTYAVLAVPQGGIERGNGVAAEVSHRGLAAPAPVTVARALATLADRRSARYRGCAALYYLHSERAFPGHGGVQVRLGTAPLWCADVPAKASGKPPWCRLSSETRSNPVKLIETRTEPNARQILQLSPRIIVFRAFVDQLPNGIVSSVSCVSTTNTARSLAGFVSLAFALTPWRSPGSSEKLCPAS